MKAAVYSEGVLRMKDVKKPFPRDDEVLIEVRAASVNPLDHHLLIHPLLRRVLFAMSKSKVARPGRDVAGQVEAVGRNVAAFKPGDQVFGCCGGAFAEYACASEVALVTKPPNVTFEQAAAVPLAGLTALQGLRDAGKLQPGQNVLINGAAGGVGTFAVQIAKSSGAHVAGVCSARNVEMVRSIGAERVFDYTRENFTKSRQHYDLVFDLVDNHSLSAFRCVMNPNGIYVGAGVLAVQSMWALLPGMLAAPMLSRLLSQIVSFIAKLNKVDLNILRELWRRERSRQSSIAFIN